MRTVYPLSSYPPLFTHQSEAVIPQGEAGRGSVTFSNICRHDLKKIYQPSGQIVLGPHIFFRHNIFLDLEFFVPKIFSVQKFFSDQNFFRPKRFFRPKSFSYSNFFSWPKKFFTPQNFLDPKWTSMKYDLWREKKKQTFWTWGCLNWQGQRVYFSGVWHWRPSLVYHWVLVKTVKSKPQFLTPLI